MKSVLSDVPGRPYHQNGHTTRSGHSFDNILVPVNEQPFDNPHAFTTIYHSYM